MIKSFKIAAIAALSVVGTTVANAADLDPAPVLTPVETKALNNFYVKVFGGAAFVFDQEFEGATPAGAPFDVDLELDTGFNIGGVIGYRYANAFGAFSPRLEVGVNYVDVGVDGGFFSGGPPTQVFDGDQSILFAGVNGLVDYDLNGDGTVLPFFGVGLGAAFVDTDANYVGGGPTILFEDDDTVFGLQLIGGVEYALTQSIAVSLEGRYFRAFNAEATRITPAGVFGTTEADIDGASINVGLSYKF